MSVHEDCARCASLVRSGLVTCSRIVGHMGIRPSPRIDAEPLDLVLLHGAGQGPESWKGVLDALPDSLHTLTPALGVNSTFSIADAAHRVVAHLDEHGLERVVVCGLSLGAMVAAQVAVDHPERIKAIGLSGLQVRPPQLLMRVQNLVLRGVPARWLERDGQPSKADLLHVLDAVAHVDLTTVLPRITAPALVLCGARDRANLVAARHAAELIPQARLRIVAGAGHAWNVTHPEEFARVVTDFASALPCTGG